MSWPPSYVDAVGPKPRSTVTLRALASNAGDTFFTPLHGETGAETYTAFMMRRNEWESFREIVLVAGSTQAATRAQRISEFAQSFFTGTQIRVETSTALKNSLRFMQKRVVDGITAIDAVATLDVLARSSSEPQSVIIGITASDIFVTGTHPNDSSLSSTSPTHTDGEGRSIITISLSRYGHPLDDFDAGILLVRTIARAIRFEPCRWFECIFNDLHSPRCEHLAVACPACLRRVSVLSRSEFDFAARYRSLHRWFTAFEGCKEPHWLDERHYAITGQNIPVDALATETKCGSVAADAAVADVPAGAVDRSKLRLLKKKLRSR